MRGKKRQAKCQPGFAAPHVPILRARTAFLTMSEWILATPLTAWEPTIARCAIRTYTHMLASACALVSARADTRSDDVHRADLLDGPFLDDGHAAQAVAVAGPAPLDVLEEEQVDVEDDLEVPALNFTRPPAPPVSSVQVQGTGGRNCNARRKRTEAAAPA